MTIKRHKGLPPLGWEMVPNMPGYIREKKAPPPKDGEQGPPGPQGEPGRDGVDGKDGRDGRDGVDGKDGLPGRDGVDGKDGRDGKDGKPGPRGERGLPGPAGKDGDDGVGIEDVTAYGRDMLVKLTDGTEKKFSLLGLSGGTPFGGGGGGSSWDPSTLPAASDYPLPTELIIKQAGSWKRATLGQLSDWLGLGPYTDYILTQNNDPIITEDGNNLVWE